MRCLIILLILSLLAACEEKPRVIHDNSATAKFLAMVGGGKPSAGGDASGTWQITRNDQPKTSSNNQDPNVRVIRPADFSGYRFSTNFQVEDPAAKKAGARGSASQPAGQPSATQPATPFMPFGAAPQTDR
jgi:hypothetical protein